ncbi:MAG TPA: Crp/Fnr family transcriptional regulator [Bryobacteraceae bacterium]
MPHFGGSWSPPQNRLLLALRGPERARFRQKLQSAVLPLGQVLHEPGERLEYVYFPTSSLISLVYTMRDGATAEMGLVGNDGVLGVELLLGGETAPHRAIVQIAGEALRIPARLFQHEVAPGADLERVLLRYTHCLLTQISQSAVCNRLHSMEQRLCRWLLMCHDRSNRGELVMTQELIANLLGGRRESVTVAAGRLQDAELIHYHRGRIKVLDRNGLESSACECYGVVQAEIDRLFSSGPGWLFSQPDEALRAAK